MDHNEMIQEMKKYFSEEPEVSIFWYDEDNMELFEIHSLPVSQLKVGQATFPKLHKTIWQKLKMKTIEKKNSGKEYNSIYLNDYTQIPRGRIFYQNNVFYVVTGKWITDYVKDLIIDEFHLQNQTVEFKYDSHWDIGHGWSSENETLDF